MTPTSKSEVKGRGGDKLLALALAVAALGNLILPETAQEVAGFDYLYLALGVLGLMFLARLRNVFQAPRAWMWAFAVLISAVPGVFVGGVTSYGVMKLTAIALIAVFALGVSSFASVDRGASYFVSIALAVGIAASVLSLLVGETTVNSRGTLFALNPIGVSRVTGLAIVITAIYAIYASKRRLIIVGAGLLATVATALTLSRGPLLSAVVGIAFALLLLLRARKTGTRWIVLIAGVVVGLVAFGITSGLFPFGGDLLRGDSGRGNIYDYAWHIFRGAPLGVGWGNFYYVGDFLYDGDDAPYAHNLYLEVATEGGLIALIVMVVVTAAVLVAGVRRFARKPDRIALVVLALYVYALVNAQFSSDIAGNRMLWVTMALTAALAAAPEFRGAKQESIARMSA
ncbi:O-antigen ligase family protein [Microbacterium stercoris]|uniref:O-antigen ligase family protein n=1 Tax=Microbacterium stercoris TaxID=2820289 RepID=A0A939QJY4_9MICO|nr:O-antigen ligase family protein [Microbacterium stercoris]MBO3663530.1 O-antigen ligase family protein [Microbacterium stercoris]